MTLDYDLVGSAVFVTAGEFEGRIGLCDDSGQKFIDEFDELELAEFVDSGFQFSTYEEDDEEPYEAAPFGIVYFGTMLSAVDQGDIPLQFLRRATISDLVARFSTLSTEIMHHALDTYGSLDYREMASLLAEQNYVMDTVWRREVDAMNVNGDAKTVFLCHSSVDKPFVRQVYNDLASQGFAPWLDEFEIKVGESIVEKISAATVSAHAVVVFFSLNSIDAPWVKREWHSVLMRNLSGSTTKLLPARIDEVNPPAILSDLRYADFSMSYNEGLRSLLQAL